ncbi:hypothetical protein B5F34_14525 [Mediterranea sp. An20]|nr:hypothetical protein B5F34_14525 [Mediterranea sp. An20]
MFGNEGDRARIHLLAERAVGNVMMQMSDGDTPPHAGKGGISPTVPASETQGRAVDRLHGLLHFPDSYCLMRMQTYSFFR